MKHIDICKHEIKSSNWHSILFKRSVIDTTIHRSSDPFVCLSLALFTSWAYVNANVTGKQCFPSPLRETNSAVSDGWGRGWAWKRAGHLKNRWDDTGKALSSISNTHQTLNKCDQLLVVVIVRHIGPFAGFCFYEVLPSSVAQGLLHQRPRETGLGKGWLLCPWRICCPGKVGSASVSTNYFSSPPLSLAEESLQHSCQQGWGLWVSNASLIDASDCFEVSGAFLSTFNANLPCHLGINNYITMSGGPNINPSGVLIILQWHCLL